MGKKRKKDAGKQARKGRSHSPIVDDLRSAAEPVIRLANSPVVAELVASALLAGAGALARSPAGTQAAEAAHEEAGALAESAEQVARDGADLAGLVAYSVAVAAGEIADRLAAAYERRLGGSEIVEQVAKAARHAADSAWEALGTDRH